MRFCLSYNITNICLFERQRFALPLAKFLWYKNNSPLLCSLMKLSNLAVWLRTLDTEGLSKGELVRVNAKNQTRAYDISLMSSYTV